MVDKGHNFISKDTDSVFKSSCPCSFESKIKKPSESTSSTKIEDIKNHKSQVLASDKKRNKKSKNELINELNELKKLAIYDEALEEAIRREKEAAKGQTVDVVMSIHYNTSYGERLIILGGHELIGNWRSDKAVSLEWTPGSIWKTTISLDQKSKDIEYKYAVVRGHYVKWEGGDNRILKLTDAIQFGNKLLLNKLEVWRK
ncbi:unnamed protein product [Blepharisma stoltei]|uniref:CBM20 domain-containing protein n=1 Tax=Blepharisma stoltei TaxID=1481888 RepID=A0AAU9J3I2_9CILI|nr:unnamed protein product [Blepharisma stoltei]